MCHFSLTFADKLMPKFLCALYR